MATSDQTIMTKPTLDLEYQDGAGGFKILTADHMGWAIQLYRNQWLTLSETIALIWKLPIWLLLTSIMHARCVIQLISFQISGL